MEPGMAGRPVVDRRGVVGGEVFAEHMQVQFGGTALSIVLRNLQNSIVRCFAVDLGDDRLGRRCGTPRTGWSHNVDDLSHELRIIGQLEPVI
jgi:hypothetical protein